MQNIPATDDRRSDPGTHADRPMSEGRRRFLVRAGQLGAAWALGGLLGGVPGGGFVWAQNERYPGKEQLIARALKPLNLETPLELLDQDITPNALFFVRSHGTLPDVDVHTWRLTVEGELLRTIEVSLEQLKRDYEVVREQAVIECAGNGRAFFKPQVRGNQWERGAIGCATWTGVRLRDILRSGGIKPRAQYIGCYGADESLNPDQVEAFSRGIPIEKAMDEHTLVAFQMNGEDIPKPNGYPVRLIVPGWVGSASQKWLTRILVRNDVHDSHYMKGMAYHVPRMPVEPGAEVDPADMRITTEWPVKSMITRPLDGMSVKAGQPLEVHGYAWAGEHEVKHVQLSFDEGKSWHPTTLRPPAEKYAWYRWAHAFTPARAGTQSVWARATDSAGNVQPVDQPWNPRGYLGNVVHKVTLKVDA